MGLISTLKWLWDPRTDAEKAYDVWDAATPLQTHIQHLTVWIYGIAEPFGMTVKFHDINAGGTNFRVNAESRMQDLNGEWSTKGVTIRGVHYPPSRIEKIDIGRVEVITKINHD